MPQRPARTRAAYGPSSKAGKVDQFAADAERCLTGGDAIDLRSVRLGPPIPNPDKILCLGLNYSDHAAEASMELPVGARSFSQNSSIHSSGRSMTSSFLALPRQRSIMKSSLPS